jgi:EAL domain-containing protein (putative c-di-GMP-specific phosphodiesterase class I)
MLLRAADAAMRRAKATRSGWATFSHLVDSAALASSSIEFELKSALKNGHIRAAVQPISRVSDLAVVEYELLARWVNSGLEQDPGPAQFIPIAEKQGLLNDILWVTLDEALSALDLRRYRLAVNVSPAQLLASDFLATLLELLERHSVDPAAITLEITEEVVFRNLERNVAILDSARSAGMQIALDDFGSGYSSLAMLDALPLDKLKIDQGLIKKAEHSARSANILAAAISLAQQLDLIACVEGVETREGLETITRMGADQVQGYFLARPQMLQDELHRQAPLQAALASVD